ncbi:DUF4123 domain-containing protein [Sulfitobacter albidus]|uniref:DUF4123 domain-containing protein n=1 Tax=Sulfitobacter albidus TaxID=2829501 RepID=A0A975JH00_9RHOB|nr:DUF4123 domain-containing protein [Sulfitobacter albidus]QUJ78132.1 DUF4123 domain-containing protein [Sulfitobacter albidus]
MSDDSVQPEAVMDYNTDPWDPEARRKETATDAPDLDVRVVPDVEPIALADATRTQACVPVALQDAIFGTRTAARFSFAVIDGAKIDGLAELLETSGLPHRCLYTKDSGLQDVAPWLVELHDGTPFVRSLFTVGDAPWALWGRGWGTVLRSAMPLDALYAHLRHFTQVRLDGPKPVFFRFWEPRVMARYLFNHHDTARENLLALMGEGEIICVDWWNDIAVHAQARVAAERPRHWPHLREDLDRIRLQIYCETLTDELGERVPRWAILINPSGLKQ